MHAGVTVRQPKPEGRRRDPTADSEIDPLFPFGEGWPAPVVLLVTASAALASLLDLI
jgi:hypothetical protein